MWETSSVARVSKSIVAVMVRVKILNGKEIYSTPFFTFSIASSLLATDWLEWFESARSCLYPSWMLLLRRRKGAKALNDVDPAVGAIEEGWGMFGGRNEGEYRPTRAGDDVGYHG